jgi:hypothetical protein
MQITYRNEKDGVETKIKLLANGKYAVTLWDLDSGECLPIARHCLSLAQAICLAKGAYDPSKTMSISVEA